MDAPEESSLRETEPRRNDGLAALDGGYDALLCDIWGVLHDGERVHPPAVAALRAFRRQGPVILITNAPRPADEVAMLIAKLGAPADCYDSIVTSGEVTISHVAERIDEAVFHLGPRRDLGLFERAGKLAGKAPRLTELESADYVLCTGLFNDESETPRDYASRLAAMHSRELPFICANPDVIVHRGADVIYCAGALAEEYRRLGGETTMIGKPFKPIYEAALAAARAVRPGLVKSRILAVGDGVATDLKGAEAFGLDALFIAGGIHRGDIVGDGFAPGVFKPLKSPPRFWALALTP